MARLRMSGTCLQYECHTMRKTTYRIESWSIFKYSIRGLFVKTTDRTNSFAPDCGPREQSDQDLNSLT